MNRQALPSMLLSVLIVCACAVALRPVERAPHREADPVDASPIAPPDDAPSADQPPAPHRPEEEAIEPAPQPTPEPEQEPKIEPPTEPHSSPEPEPPVEPEPVVAREVPAPWEPEAAVELAETEPFAEADEAPDPTPSMFADDWDLPSIAEPPLDEPPTSPSAFVGPPSEAAFANGSAPDIEESEREEEPLAADESPSFTTVEPTEAPTAAAEPLPRPSQTPESIVIPRGRAGLPVGARDTRAAPAPSRKVKPARPETRSWSPSR